MSLAVFGRFRKSAQPKTGVPDWDKHGLIEGRSRRSQIGGSPALLPSLRRQDQLRLALEEAGGLFALFGQFLSLRTDLLPRHYVRGLRKIRSKKRASPGTLLKRKFSGGLSEFEWVRTTPCTEVYQAVYQGQPVITEFFLQDACQIDEAVWDIFVREIQFLAKGPEEMVARQWVLEQFREWMRIQADIDARRAILTNLQENSSLGINRFPQLVPDLQSATCLAYEKYDGTPMGEGGEMTGGIDYLKIFVEGMLERTFVYSLIDVEMQVENFVVLPEGKLGFRAVPPFLGVPVDGYYETFQYVASTVAGDIPRSVRMLSRLVAGEDCKAVEQELTTKLSSLQPELGAKLHSGSLILFENCGRAAARCARQLPLNLQLFHRNLAAIVEYCEALHAEEDLVKETMWPVTGRVLRCHATDLIATKKSQDWLMSSFLLFFSTLRQAEVAMERTRDTDQNLTLVVEHKKAEFSQARKNRRTSALIRTAVMLVGFFFFMQVLINAGSVLMQLFSGSAAALLAYLIYREITQME
ncbi:MAG: hypothetical protein A3F68_10545 [Acidobacteria bacterium RIFCSPLOWO2_12_FULL_54_10]|nr:MAG: hypothetical protein A3F68_10545 [Acidobacteria bacterium RIFCSPLOWO2_12_FULL_54_10]